MTKIYSNFKDILQDPAIYYDLPEEVLEDQTLSQDQKIQVLKHWKYDAILLQMASAENMGGGENSPLDKILKCLGELEK